MNHRQWVVDVAIIFAVVAATVGFFWEDFAAGEWSFSSIAYDVVLVPAAIAVAGIPAFILARLKGSRSGAFRLLWGLQGAFALAYAAVLYCIGYAAEMSTSGEDWDLVVYSKATFCAWGAAYLGVTGWAVYRAVKSFPTTADELLPCVIMLGHPVITLPCVLYFCL